MSHSSVSNGDSATKKTLLRYQRGYRPKRHVFLLFFFTKTALCFLRFHGRVFLGSTLHSLSGQCHEKRLVFNHTTLGFLSHIAVFPVEITSQKGVVFCRDIATFFAGTVPQKVVGFYRDSAAFPVGIVPPKLGILSQT